jgi:AbiEi antitoxin C-terminal domain
VRETVPRALTADGPRVLRPRDLADLWTVPHKELVRLSKKGICQQIAYGYWLLRPSEAWGDDAWRPSLEALAASLAIADYGNDNVALIRLSAARLLGAIPRARAAADVAVPIRRHPMQTIHGPITFADREVRQLDVQATQTELGKFWITTPEQTIVDLANDVDPAVRGSEAWTAVTTLRGDADWDLVTDLAGRQRRRSPVMRLAKLLAEDRALS